MAGRPVRCCAWLAACALLLASALLAAACAPVPAAQPVEARPPTDVARSSAVPVDPPPVVDGDITLASHNGLRILVKRNPGAELAAIELAIVGGAWTWRPEQAGIELLALRTAVEGGTQTLDEDAFARRLGELGSTLHASSLPDYSVIEAKCLTAAFDETFSLLVDSFLSPALPAAEIEVGRQQQLTHIRRDEETPDGRLGLLALRAVYGGHPYANRSVGTVESVTRLSRAELEAHLASLRQTSRLVLVVVGDVSVERVQALARERLATLERGTPPATGGPAPRFDAPKSVVEPDELPTNYLQASFIGPSWGDADFAAGIVAMHVLDSRVWEEVRTKRNLSYAPSAFFRWTNRVTRGGLYVSAVEPSAALAVMLDEARRLQKTPVADGELAGVKAQLRTAHLMDNESTDGQASGLVTAMLVGGDWRLFRTLPERIKGVTPADVQRFASARIRNLQTVVLGDPGKISQSAQAELFESL